MYIATMLLSQMSKNNPIILRNQPFPCLKNHFPEDQTLKIEKNAKNSFFRNIKTLKFSNYSEYSSRYYSKETKLDITMIYLSKRRIALRLSFFNRVNTVSTDLYELFRTVVEVHITKKVHITFLSLPMRGKANRGKFPHKHTSGQVDSQRIWSSQDGRQAKNQVFDRAQSRGS